MNVRQLAAQLSHVADDPRAEVECLMAHVLQISRAQLLTSLVQPDSAQWAQIEALVARRAQGEPVAYLLGECGFWTLMLRVTSDVLVPRADTETLVEWALQLISPPLPQGESGRRIADLGTGSGCIALSLARERADAEILATDFSAAALAVAKSNAVQNGLRNVEFLGGHWCQPLKGRFDLIISNPPYIAEGDPHLTALAHEPRTALTSGADGLDALREIVTTAAAFLKPGGWLLLEHGYDQAAAVRSLLEQAGFQSVQSRRDLGGHERASGGQWHE